MPSQKSARLKESVPPVWRNRFCWLPFVGALITLIPTLLVILNLWEGLPQQLDFSEIRNLDEVSFLAADLDARTFYFYRSCSSKKVRLVWAVLVPIAVSIFVFVPNIKTFVPNEGLLRANF